jgi:hypothetical protein
MNASSDYIRADALTVDELHAGQADGTLEFFGTDFNGDEWFKRRAITGTPRGASTIHGTPPKPIVFHTANLSFDFK